MIDPAALDVRSKREAPGKGWVSLLSVVVAWITSYTIRYGADWEAWQVAASQADCSMIGLFMIGFPLSYAFDVLVTRSAPALRRRCVTAAVIGCCLGGLELANESPHPKCSANRYRLALGSSLHVSSTPPPGAARPTRMSSSRSTSRTLSVSCQRPALSRSRQPIRSSHNPR